MVIVANEVCLFYYETNYQLGVEMASKAADEVNGSLQGNHGRGRTA